MARNISSQVIRIHGRPLKPREQVAFGTCILFGLLLVLTCIRILRKYIRYELVEGLHRNVPILVACSLRLLSNGLEFGFKPETRDAKVDAVIAALDAVSLIPVVLALISCILPSVDSRKRYMPAFKSNQNYNQLAISSQDAEKAEEETGMTFTKRLMDHLTNPMTQRTLIYVSLAILSTFIFLGTILSFDPSDPLGSAKYTAGVSFLRLGVILFCLPLTVFLPLAMWRVVEVAIGRRVTTTVTPWYLRLVICGGFLVTRFVWAVGSSFAVRHAGSPFNPFRDTKSSTWVNLWTGLVMEGAVLGGCMLPD